MQKPKNLNTKQRPTSSKTSGVYWMFAAICTLFILFIPAQKNESPLQQKTATVIIHGTIRPDLCLLSPTKTYHDDLDSYNPYVRALDQLRSDGTLKHSVMLMGDGLRKINANTINRFIHHDLDKAEAPLAACHFFGTYHILAKKYASDGDYYTFGWNGQLSSSAREQEAYYLYEELIRIKEQAAFNGYDLSINLITHSHGGNVALYLAKWEEEQHQGLCINALHMFGCPIQSETVDYIGNSIFKTILNYYSDFDMVQSNDVVSTQSHKSHRRIGDLVDMHTYAKQPDRLVRDIHLMVNQEAKALSHASMGAMGCYHYGKPLLFHRTKIKKGIAQISPHAVCVLTPVFDDLVRKIRLERPNLCHIDLDIIGRPGTLHIHSYDYNDVTNQNITGTNNLHELLEPHRSYTQEAWSPTAPTMFKRISQGWNATKHAIFTKSQTKLDSKKANRLRARS
ncbi:hypothetical protein HOL34_00305 [bacterium]|nr:hypothetical protein [bacterium]MBT4577623.1 hypothetical protein [bacterium]MBT5345492.1 hypothetical protein [bacterium]MBT6131186.1 hypothetical protein [bacterium]MBT6528540.1 hypothetical protein [bacterium]